MNANVIRGLYYNDLNDDTLLLPFVLLQGETDKEWLALIKEWWNHGTVSLAHENILHFITLFLRILSLDEEMKMQFHSVTCLLKS